MALVLAVGSRKRASLVVVFALGGIFTGAVATLEDSITAELVPASHHGMAHSTLAAVNAVGDFASNVLLRGLWTPAAPKTASATTGA